MRLRWWRPAPLTDEQRAWLYEQAYWMAGARAPVTGGDDEQRRGVYVLHLLEQTRKRNQEH